MEKTDKQSEENIVKIVITGPESTGKSTIASALAKHFNTVWVKEYLREFAEEKYSNNQKLLFSDNIIIAKRQKDLENKAIEVANKYIFCDTDILQTVVYSYEYYNKVQLQLEEWLQNNNTDLYLLLNLDISWKEDHLRDKPNDRKRMYDVFEKTLIKYTKNYIIIKGSDDIRLQNAINIINNRF